MAAFPPSLLASRSGREQVAFASLGVVAVLTLANLLFNIGAAALGYTYPQTTFLWRADDNFADFFSLLRTYPGGQIADVADGQGLHSILPQRPASLHEVTGPAAAVTHFHMMPLSTLISLGALELMRFIDPVLLFLALLAGLLLWWAAVAFRFAESRAEALAWVGLGIICYPVLFMASRGNLHAGLTALLLVQALMLGLQRRAPLVAAILLAVAVNIRPNAILFAAPLLAFYWPQKWRFGAALAVAGSAILAASLLISTARYPEYRLSSILAGLESYAAIYVVGNWGMQYGSSLFGALRAIYGSYHPALVTAAIVSSLLLLGGGVAAWAAKRIDDALLLFLAAAAYCLGSTVLGDYHLMAFLVVPLALAPTYLRGPALEDKLKTVVLVAVCLILSPKNYIFYGAPRRPTSLQVVLNPAILMAAALLVLAYAVFSRKLQVRASQAA